MKNKISKTLFLYPIFIFSLMIIGTKTVSADACVAPDYCIGTRVLDWALRCEKYPGGTYCIQTWDSQRTINCDADCRYKRFDWGVCKDYIYPACKTTYQETSGTCCVNVTSTPTPTPTPTTPPGCGTCNEYLPPNNCANTCSGTACGRCSNSPNADCTWGSKDCGGGGGACSGISYYLSNSSPSPDTTVTVDINRTSATSCNGNWDWVGLKLDGNPQDLALCYADGSNCSEGYHASVNSDSSGSHTLQFTVNSGDCLCNTTSFTTSSLPPTCTVNLTPDTATVQAGSATTLTASVTVGEGSVSQVDFASGNTGIVTVNPASDTSVVYSTQATGVAVNSTTVRADVMMSGSSRCNDTSTVNVTAPGPWWQVKDADVTTNGDLISPIPGSCSLPACNPVFGLRGAGGFPGVPAYGGANADFLSGAGTGSAAESPYNWLAASRYLGKIYDYAYFRRQIPDDVVINELAPPVTGGTFNSGGAPSRGYVWYHWNGATVDPDDIDLGDLTINGNVNLVGARKVVLLVEGANTTINGRIRLQNPGQGFFMMVVGKTQTGLKGDILVDPSVDNIEGIFLAESEFRTGAASSQLQVRGSIVAYEGVSLQRDLGASNVNTPAEVFEYAPDLIATFPSVFTQRRMRWKEVAP